MFDELFYVGSHGMYINIPKPSSKGSKANGKKSDKMVSASHFFYEDKRK